MLQEDSKVTGWNEEMPNAVTDDFKAILNDMKALREITFPRCIQPSKLQGPTVERSQLLVSTDGLGEVSCALANAR
jgi:hypothetical protein